MNRHGKKTAKRPVKRSAAHAPATKRGDGCTGIPGKSAGDAAVGTYIASLPAWQRELAQRFDDLMTREVPGVRRVIKWGLPFYGVKYQGWFVSCGGFTNALKVTFFQGVSLKPMPPSGKGKQLRCIDIQSSEDFNRAQLASWIRQAARLPGFGSQATAPANGR